MKTCEISSMYTLSETIAADLFADLTYPWEAPPKIGAKHWILRNMSSGQKMCGLQRAQRLRLRRLFTDQ